MPFKDPIKAKENARERSKRWRGRHPEKAKEVARNSARKIRGYIGPIERSKRATERNKKRWADKEWREANETKIVSALNSPQSVATRTPKITAALQSEPIRQLSVDRMTMLRKKPSFKKKLYAGWQGKRKPSKPEMTLFATLKARGIEGLKAQYNVDWYDLDIAHLPTKTDIEVDGPYWHRGKRLERDAARDKFLISLGWKVMRIKLVKNKVTSRDLSRIIKHLTDWRK